MSAAKQFDISKHLVMEAFKAVKANAGSAGVDKQSIEEFETNLKNNLYKIWNRMSSGAYLPPPVKAVAIPKKSGGERILGVPTVADRVAQMVVKMTFEPLVEPHFLADSYGYRPGKSALDAIGVTRKRCWGYGWVLEWDIKGLFDNISHDLLMKAVRKHTSSKWVLLYIERWLNAPLQLQDGSIVSRTKGTPQGGVISPCLANLFLHYAFDMWMGRAFPKAPWCRYADDGLVHCSTLSEAETLKAALAQRLAECGLSMHPDKTKIIYCKSAVRRGDYKETQFDFLGYTFRPRTARTREGKLFLGFTPAVSNAAVKGMRANIRRWGLRNRSDLELDEISKRFDPILRGWLEYYGRFYPSALHSVFRQFNRTLVSWANRKYRNLRGRKTRIGCFLKEVQGRQPALFIHWKRNMVKTFA